MSAIAPSSPVHPIDELDRPRTIPQLLEYLREHGERVSRFQIYRRIKEGLLPVTKAGRMMTTARAYFAALTPKVSP